MQPKTLTDLPYELLFQLTNLLITDDPASLFTLESTNRTLRTFIRTSGVLDDVLTIFKLQGLPDCLSTITKRDYLRLCFLDTCDRCHRTDTPAVRLWFFNALLCESCAQNDDIWMTRDEMLSDISLDSLLGPGRGPVLASDPDAVVGDETSDADDMMTRRNVLVGLPFQAHTIPYSDEYTLFRRSDVRGAVQDFVVANKEGRVNRWTVQKQKENVHTGLELRRCYRRDAFLRDWTDATKTAVLSRRLVQDFDGANVGFLSTCPSFYRYTKRPLHRLHHVNGAEEEEYARLADALVSELADEMFNSRVLTLFDIAAVNLQPYQVAELRKMFYCKVCRAVRPEERVRPFAKMNDIYRHRGQLHRGARDAECFGGIKEIWDTL